MSKQSWKTGRDLIVFITQITKTTNENIHTKMTFDGRPYRTACIVNKKDKKALAACIADVVIPCDYRSEETILKSLLPYRDSFLAISARGEVSLEWLSKLIPHIPYLRTPTRKSLAACTDKILMRKLLRTANKKMTPKFTIVHDSTSETQQRIEDEVGFPLVVKPSGLASSQLVSICFHQEELEKVLRKTTRKIKSLYREKGSSKVPQILVEQFMEGEMYSIDCYVTSRGAVHNTPLVKVTTGRSIGFDDFFGYSRMTPTTLSKSETTKAQGIAKECIHAIGLRNSSAHIELMKTDGGWKVIEIGARIGGYRHLMYELSFGINHAWNDVRIRIPEKFSPQKKAKSNTAVLEFFAKQEGYLTKLSGLRKVKKLESLHEIIVHAKESDMCRFAKNGGKKIVSVVLTNKKRSSLLADIRRLEKFIVIETSKRPKQ